MQRRKSAEDELAMREFLVEGDVISAEVQQIFHDGALGLHTRSLKYGKLAHGSMVAVSSKLIKRCKNHFHELPCGVFLVLGSLFCFVNRSAVFLFLCECVCFFTRRTKGSLSW